VLYFRKHLCHNYIYYTRSRLWWYKILNHPVTHTFPCLFIVTLHLYESQGKICNESRHEYIEEQISRTFRDSEIIEPIENIKFLSCVAVSVEWRNGALAINILFWCAFHHKMGVFIQRDTHVSKLDVVDVLHKLPVGIVVHLCGRDKEATCKIINSIMIIRLEMERKKLSAYTLMKTKYRIIAEAPTNKQPAQWTSRCSQTHMTTYSSVTMWHWCKES